MRKRQSVHGGAAVAAAFLLALCFGGDTSAVLARGGGAAKAKTKRVAPRQQARGGAPAAPKKALFGPFSLENYAIFDLKLQKNSVVATLTGNKVRARSNLYDADAQKITFLLARVGTPVRQKLTDSVATGGVRIVLRNPEAGRITIVTCDKAVYKATVNPLDRGRIDLTGSIRAEISDPAAVGPVVLTAKTGYIDLVSPEETNVVLTEGNANGTLREPPPKPAAPKKGP